MKDVVAAFKEEYIKEGMSDFEKEMEIIRYLVENVDYDLSLSDKKIQKAFAYFLDTKAGSPSAPRGISTVPWIRGRA